MDSSATRPWPTTPTGRGFSAEKLEIYFEPGRVVGAFPTHRREVLIFVQWRVRERRRFKSDLERNYLATIRSIPAVRHRLGAAQRTSRIAGLAELPNLFRQPFGPGWALVGDAGHHKDPLLARGISDAWRDSQLLADALSGSWGEEHRLKVALRHYQEIRDYASMPVARLNARLARLDEPLDALAQLWTEAAAAEAAAEKLLAEELAWTNPEL
jgi:flavin-dependent dehydrogenase